MKYLGPALLAALLCGCASTRPGDDLGFSPAGSLAAFDGCYANQGETGPGAGPRYLSRGLWPKADLAHTQVTAVQVQAVAEGTVRVTAYAGNQRLRQDTFRQGQDFSFQGGRISISQAMGSAATESGNPFIGAGMVTLELGVDAAGNGRMEESSAFAGTAFLVIPVVGGTRDAARFRRADGLCGAAL